MSTLFLSSKLYMCAVVIDNGFIEKVETKIKIVFEKGGVRRGRAYQACRGGAAEQ